MNLYLTYTLAEIDSERRRIYDKERGKALRKGKPMAPWSDSTNSLAAILSTPPAGTRVIENDGEPMILP
jgi:hypothetical protein